MSDFSTLINAASLKGYLRASNAKIEAIRWADDIIATESMRLGTRAAPDTPAFVRNEDVRIPEPVLVAPEEALPYATTAGTHDDLSQPPAVFPRSVEKAHEELAPEAVIAAPETGLTDANETPPAIRGGAVSDAPSPTQKPSRGGRGFNPDNLWEEWQLETLRQMKADDALVSDIALAVNKTTTQVHNKWTWMRKQPGDAAESNVDVDGWPKAAKPKKAVNLGAPRLETRDEAIARLVAAMPPAKDQPHTKLKRDDIPRLLSLLGELDMKTVSVRVGSQACLIDKLLKKYGIDYRVLPPKTTAYGEHEPSMPLMQFETVKVRDTWGHESERQIPVPIGEYEDPETGATVTKYPPGYAYGTHPQKNAQVNGGA